LKKKERGNVGLSEMTNETKSLREEDLMFNRRKIRQAERREPTENITRLQKWNNEAKIKHRKKQGKRQREEYSGSLGGCAPIGYAFFVLLPIIFS
jgi:hypothetical protein